jgi:tetratricopeptide (TPR) repeat protein
VTPPGPARDEPLREAATLLASAESASARDAPALLERVLEALDRARDGGGFETPRAAAHRAEALRRLGRLREAAAAYARALGSELDHADALHDGLQELSERLCGHEEVLALCAAASARHPGRSWQWDAIAERARERLACESDAPFPAVALVTLREEVARRLSASPCAHDDARPVTQAAIAALGHDPARVLAWVARLGACCCDCQVARVRGPREPSAPPSP